MASREAWGARRKTDSAASIRQESLCSPSTRMEQAPRWFDGDVLLLQKLACPPDFDGILLWSDFAKEMLQFIIEDRNRAEALALI